MRLIKEERGFGMSAMLTVLGVIAVLTILGLALLPLTETETTETTREELAAKVLYVAESGANDYLWHLNKNPDYFKTTVHPAQGKDNLGNDRWKAFQDGYYHLEVSENTGTTGVTVESTGRLQQGDITVTRTVRTIISKRSFTKYIYFTDHEVVEKTGDKIWFTTGDIIQGPLHSNDYIHISGAPVFKQKVTTGKTLDKQQGSTPSFEQGYEENVSQINMPPTNTDLKTWALAGGYYYYGTTTIDLLQDGTLNINNGNSQSKGPTGIVSLPTNGIIYVDGLSDVKGTADNADVFVKGTLSGQLTIASKNIIYITGDITYHDSQADMLGLVAENYAYILHYWSANGLPPYNTDVAPYNIEINAAIFAVNHSFGFESYDKGSRKGTITLCGSLAQRYRGPVGLINTTGYVKNYNYDQRMLYSEPPHFIEPLDAGFEISSWEELNK